MPCTPLQRTVTGVCGIGEGRRGFREGGGRARHYDTATTIATGWWKHHASFSTTGESQHEVLVYMVNLVSVKSKNMEIITIVRHNMTVTAILAWSVMRSRASTQLTRDHHHSLIMYTEWGASVQLVCLYDNGISELRCPSRKISLVLVNDVRTVEYC